MAESKIINLIEKGEDWPRNEPLQFLQQFGNTERLEPCFLLLAVVALFATTGF
ncbi:MAG: hypothetical protein R3D58_09835 [Saprospiraceae bacterium]